MAIIPIRTLGDPVLRAEAAQVDTFDQTLVRLSEDMFETMYAAPGVGLAAPQIGLSLSFFVYDDGQGGKGAVANPRMTIIGDEQTDEEGCLSIPGLYHDTTRAMKVRLEGLDLRGDPIELEAEELLARIFQHETDHLHGMLFIDRLPEDGRRQVMAELRERELGVGSNRSPRAARRR
jgi:peptide deformylase